MPLKSRSPKLLGLLTSSSRTIRNTYHISLICLALLLFGTATSLRAQDEPKKDEPQQEAESKQDKEQGKKETKSEKKEQKHKTGEPTARLKAVIWHPTIDVNQLNLFYGAGGKEDAPAPGAKYKFKKEDMNGTSPKFDVEDDQGIKWRVKLGQEPRAETAATRLLFAAGYFVDEDYYVDELLRRRVATVKARAILCYRGRHRSRRAPRAAHEGGQETRKLGLVQESICGH